jgi:hypothetical protein
MHSHFNVFVIIHIVEYSLKLNEISSHKNMFEDVMSALRHVLNVNLISQFFDHPIKNPFSLMTLNVLISFVIKNKVLQFVLYESNYYGMKFSISFNNVYSEVEIVLNMSLFLLTSRMPLLIR